MATTTFECNKDSRIANRESDSVSFGSGTSDGLPVGLYNGYLYRSLLGFQYSFSGMVSITSAVLHIRTSSQIHVAFGSDPDVTCQRLTSSWSEGTSNGLSTTNAVEWDNQPSRTALNEVTVDVTTSESTWETFTITGIMQDALAAGVFYGLVLRAANEASSTDVTEFYSREWGSSDAYITVTYTTNTAPLAPQLNFPSVGEITADLTPDLAFIHDDTDGDACLNYDLQVSTDPTFAAVTHWNISAQTTGLSSPNVTRTYAGTALTNGVTYYWRARTRSSTGVTGPGPWSTGWNFKTAALPTTSLTEPSATGRIFKCSFTPGSGWASPRLNLTWSFACSQGGTQTHYEVEVNEDSGGSPGASLYDSGKTASTAQTLVVPATLTEGNYYHVRVKVWCSHGAESAFTGYFRDRARWGVVLHRFDTGSTPTSWSVSTINTTVPANTAVSIEYSSNSTTSTPATFYSSLGAAALNRYFFYRAYLFGWGASPATSPSLDKLVLSYSANALIPDQWTREDTTNSFVDEATYVYGTQSLKMLGKGSGHSVAQLVKVVPNTDYVLSARIKSLGDSGALVAIAPGSAGPWYVTSPEIAVTADWQRYQTPVWNSGENTEAWIRTVQDGAGGTTAWFDAIKFEATKVVTPWTPSFLGEAVVLDAGGLNIDASQGGIFRLRGSSGGTADRVDLGNHGLELNGFGIGAGSTFPTGNLTVGDRWFRTDYNMEFFWDGTRWQTCQIFTHQMEKEADEIWPWAATTTRGNRTGAPDLIGTDLFLIHMRINFFVSGGTALSGSHKWVGTFMKMPTGNSETTIATINIDSGSSSVWRTFNFNINALLNNGTEHYELATTWTKTGTPGNLFEHQMFNYRVVAT